MTTPDGVQITGAHGERYDEVLTAEALAFLADLHRTFDAPRLQLLQARQDRYEELAGRHAGLPARDPGGPRRALAGRTTGARPDRPSGRDHRPDRRQDDHQCTQLRGQGLVG
jgi:malate synthase